MIAVPHPLLSSGLPELCVFFPVLLHQLLYACLALFLAYLFPHRAINSTLSLNFENLS